MTGTLEDFPRLQAVLQEGRQRQLHSGVQVYISLQGRTVLDCGFGLAGPDRPLSSAARMLWRSAGKPLTAALILQQLERGQLQLQTSLAEILPEARDTDKAQITVWQLLTHTSGFPTVETGWPEATWDAAVHTVLASPLQLLPGTAAYHPQSSWFLLGEILRRLHGPHCDFAGLIHLQLLAPLQLVHTSCGLDPQSVVATAEPLPVLYDRVGGQLVPSSYNGPLFVSRPSPGGNLRGPVRELGRFYEMLQRGGALEDGTRFLQPETVALMTRPQRVGLYDQTLQHQVDFGLGVITNSSHYGPDTVPYGFGRRCSEATYGHGGSQCAMAFCDPQYGLVVAWAANGFCGEGQHQRRNRAINEAIYEEVLGLSGG